MCMGGMVWPEGLGLGVKTRIPVESVHETTDEAWHLSSYPLYEAQLPAFSSVSIGQGDSGDGSTLCLLQKGCIIVAGQAESNAHGIVIG